VVLGRFGWVWVAPYFNKCALQRQTKLLKIAPSSPNIQAKAFVVQGLVPPFFKQTQSCPQVCTVTWHDVISKMGPCGSQIARALRARAILLVFEIFTRAYLFQIALEIL